MTRPEKEEAEPAAEDWLPWAVGAAAAAAFLPTLRSGFVNWDDEAFIVRNVHCHGLSLANVKWMFTTLLSGPYQPLSWLSLAADWSLWGGQAPGFHLTNLLLHALNAVLYLFLGQELLRRVLPPASARLGAAAAALLFALHPLRVESVAWVTERRDVLSGAFYLLSALLYVREAQPGRNLDWGRLTAPLAAFAAALLSKGIVVTLPVALHLLDVYPLRRLPGDPRRWLEPGPRKVLLEKLPFWLMAVPMALLGAAGQAHLLDSSMVYDYGFGERAALAAYRCVFYVVKTLWPSGLSPLYDQPFHFDPWGGRYLACAGAIAAVFAGLIAARRRWPAGLAAATFYAVTLFPAVGLLRLSPQVTADRYTYFACLSWPLLAGGGLGLLARGRTPLERRLYKPALAVLGAVLAALFALTVRQTAVWRDSGSLWARAAAVVPLSPIARNNLGNWLLAQGRAQEAQEQYRKALAIQPAFSTTHYNLGKVYATAGYMRQAISEYREAIRYDPENVSAYNNLGVGLASIGQGREAVGVFLQAARLKIDPDFPGALEMKRAAVNNLGNALLELGRAREAVDAYRRALAIDDGNPDTHYNLGVAWLRLKERDEAVREFREALRLRPWHADAARRLEETLKDVSAARPSPGRAPRTKR